MQIEINESVLYTLSCHLICNIARVQITLVAKVRMRIQQHFAQTTLAKTKYKCTRFFLLLFIYLKKCLFTSSLPSVYQFNFSRRSETVLLRQRPRSFISKVRPTVHTNPSRKRNFSILNALKNEGIDKRRFFCFCVDGKHFKNRTFQNRRPHDNRDFPDGVFFEHKSKLTGGCCVFKFLRCNVNGARDPQRKGFATQVCNPVLAALLITLRSTGEL